MMKLIKTILPVVVFSVGIVSAVASHAFLVDAMGFHPSTSVCSTGQLVSPPSGKTCAVATTGTRCKVQFLVNGELEQVDAFAANGSCSTSPNQHLFYQ